MESKIIMLWNARTCRNKRGEEYVFFSKIKPGEREGRGECIKGDTSRIENEVLTLYIPKLIHCP